MPRSILKTAVQTAVTLVPEIVSGVGSVTNASNAIKVQTGQQAVDSQSRLSALRGLEKFFN